MPAANAFMINAACLASAECLERIMSAGIGSPGLHPLLHTGNTCSDHSEAAPGGLRRCSSTAMSRSELLAVQLLRQLRLGAAPTTCAPTMG